jgi:hypothetical protein
MRRQWLAAIDVVGRGQAGVLPVIVSSGGAPQPAPALMFSALTDTSRVIVLGDETRPRLCASVHGGMVARFLPV